MLDFFLEAGNPDEQLKQSKDLDRRVAAAEANQGAADGAQDAADSPEVVNIMEAVKGMLSEKYVQSVGGIFCFQLKGATLITQQEGSMIRANNYWTH